MVPRVGPLYGFPVFPLRSSMIKDGFLIFQSILRERKIPRQHLRILHVFCEYTRSQAKPGFCGHPQGLRQQLTQKASQRIGREKGWVEGLRRQEKGPSPFTLSSFFSKPLPSPRPLPNLRLPRRLLTTVPQYTVSI